MPHYRMLRMLFRPVLGGRRSAFFILELALLLASSTILSTAAPVGSQTARTSPDWLRQATIYQLWLRSFTLEGTLRAATERLPYLADLGVTFVYLSPFLKGPHPFIVSDYYAVNPELGTDQDLRSLVAEAHKLKMKVMMDVVFYHSASNNVLMQDPDNYQRDAEGKIVLGYWQLPRLNFEKPKLRRYLAGNLVHWVKEFGIDGFRCDVSGGLPLTFWQEARQALDAVNPGVILLAESDMPEEQLRAFDISYNYPFYYFPLVSVLQKGEPASLLREQWARSRQAFPRGARFLYFSDNHDQPRAVLTFSQKGALAAAVLNFTMDGIPFVYNGQELGDVAGTAWDSQVRNVIDLPSPGTTPSGAAGETWRTYKRLFQLRKEEEALNSGRLIWIPNNQPEHVLSFIRRKTSMAESQPPVYDWPNRSVPVLNTGDEEILVVINLSNRKLKTLVNVPWTDYSPLQDLLDPTRQIRSKIQESRVVYELGAFEFIVGKRLPPKTIPVPEK